MLVVAIVGRAFVIKLYLIVKSLAPYRGAPRLLTQWSNGSDIEGGYVMNKHTPEGAGEITMPQFENKLQVYVNRVIAFSHNPHSDEEK